MTRHLTLPLTLVALLVVPRAAAGQVFEFYPYDENDSESLDSVAVAKYLNSARCLCDEDRSSDEAPTTFYLHLRDTSGNYTTDEVYIYLGDDCDNDAVSITEQCVELAVINHSDFNEEQIIPIPANLIVDPEAGECSEQEGGSSTVYVIMGDVNNTATATYTLSFDTQPPGAPASVSADPGESSVTVSWDPPDDDAENIEYYNVLCAVGGAPVSGVSAESKASWVSTRAVCDKDLGDATIVASTDCSARTGGLEDGAVADPCYVCGAVASTSTELRLEGFENGQVVQVAVVAIDKYGNVSEVSAVADATPELTTDFAEQYHEAGGRNQAGYCFVATAVYGDYDHPTVRRLRAFRDGSLLRSEAGRAFVAWYYDAGPVLAQLVGAHPELRLLAWVGLGTLSGFLPGRGPGPLAAGLPLGLALLGLVGLRRARRLRREVAP